MVLPYPGTIPQLWELFPCRHQGIPAYGFSAGSSLDIWYEPGHGIHVVHLLKRKQKNDKLQCASITQTARAYVLPVISLIGMVGSFPESSAIAMPAAPNGHIFLWTLNNFIIANKSLVRFWKSDGSIKFTSQMHVQCILKNVTLNQHPRMLAQPLCYSK